MLEIKFGNILTFGKLPPGSQKCSDAADIARNFFHGFDFIGNGEIFQLDTYFRVGSGAHNNVLIILSRLRTGEEMLPHRHRG